MGYSLWGRKELDMTEHVHIQVMPYNICLRGTSRVSLIAQMVKNLSAMHLFHSFYFCSVWTKMLSVLLT